MQDIKLSEKLSEEEWRSHRQILLQAEKEQAAAVDKHLLALSSGAIGLSAVFLFNLGHQAQRWSVSFLVASWFSFGISIVTTLVSFLSSQAGYRHRREEWDRMYETHKYDPDCQRDSLYESWTKWLNGIAIISFLVGITLFIVFAITNLSQSSLRKGNHEQETREIRSQEGKAPPKRRSADQAAPS